MSSRTDSDAPARRTRGTVGRSPPDKTPSPWRLNSSRTPRSSRVSVRRRRGARECLYPPFRRLEKAALFGGARNRVRLADGAKSFEDNWFCAAHERNRGWVSGNLLKGKRIANGSRGVEPRAPGQKIRLPHQGLFGNRRSAKSRTESAVREPSKIPDFPLEQSGDATVRGSRVDEGRL